MPIISFNSFKNRPHHVALNADGIARMYATPEDFIHDSIEVFHNGRRLKLAIDNTSATGDYYVSESNGLNTGFNTVILVSFTPRESSDLSLSYFVPGTPYIPISSSSIANSLSITPYNDSDIRKAINNVLDSRSPITHDNTLKAHVSRASTLTTNRFKILKLVNSLSGSK